MEGCEECRENKRQSCWFHRWVKECHRFHHSHRRCRKCERVDKKVSYGFGKWGWHRMSKNRPVAPAQQLSDNYQERA